MHMQYFQTAWQRDGGDHVTRGGSRLTHVMRAVPRDWHSASNAVGLVVYLRCGGALHLAHRRIKR
jgi:hypothetical protein